MPMLLLFVGLVCLAAGAAALLLDFVQADLRILDPVSAVIAGVGGLILIGMGSIAARLQRIADAIEARSVRDALGPAMEPLPPSTVGSSRGAAAVAAALDDLDLGDGDEPAPVVPPPPASAPPLRPAPQPTIAMRPPEPPAEPAPAATAVPAPPVRAAPGPAMDWPEWPRPTPAARPAPLQGAGPMGPPAPPSSASAAEPPAAAGTAPVPPPSAAEPDTAPSPPPDAAGEALRVLKSGVIEGMAYTLYSDGSVDAELPGGTRHFASIAEWRAHLREGV